MLRLFCSFIIAVSSLQVDCDDGKKGGCQHTCYQNQCRCPKCWELDENGLDCVPEHDKVKINCSPSGIAVLVSECVIPGERTLGLRDFNCVPKQDPNGDYLFSTTLEKCGTMLKINENATEATFKNTVIAKPYRRKGVAFGRDLKFDFQCKYDMNYQDVHAGQEIENGVFETETAASGSLKFGLRWFTGSDYATEATEDHPKRVGNQIFFDVHALAPLENLSFFVENCTVSEKNSDLTYSIIMDRCGDKYTKTKFESGFFSKTSVQISYTAFTFVSSGDLSQQSVSCAVTICEPGFTCPQEPVCEDDSR